VNVETIKEVRGELVEMEEALTAIAVRSTQLHQKTYPEIVSSWMTSSSFLVKKIASLFWAIRTFPQFDRSAINKWERRAIPIKFNGKKSTFNLWVPVFGSCTVGSSEASSISIRPVHGQFSQWGHLIPMISFEYLSENREELENLNGRAEEVELRAKCPGLPSDVSRRLTEVGADRFEHLSIVFEAQWTGELIKDPLVIGTIFDHDFLIDQYDVTKLERYIVSEFCQKPSEEK